MKNKKKLPKYLYSYANMNHGEFKLAILKVIGEDDVFYNVINEHGVKTIETKSHVDNFDLSPTGYHYVIYSERNDELARKILCEDQEKYIHNRVMYALNELNKLIEKENKLLNVIKHNEIVVYNAEDKIK